MEYINIFTIDKYRRRSSGYNLIGAGSVSTFFFGGSASITEQTPSDGMMEAIADYVLDHSLPESINKNNELHFEVKEMIFYSK